MPRACFVSATDTEVGKTIVAASIVAGLRAQGIAARARKPVITGVGALGPPVASGPDSDLAGLADDELLAAVSEEHARDIAIVRCGLAASPHLAAARTGSRIDGEMLVSALRDEAHRSEALVVEGIGGLLVPFGDDWDVRRLASELGWPVLVVARAGLGTINHTLLTLEAARRAELDVRAVVLSQWPAEPDEIERSNRTTIEELGAVEVAVFPRLEMISRSNLAEAAATLPLERWLAPAT